MKKVLLLLNAVVLCLILLACLMPGWFTSYDPNKINFSEKLSPPSSTHWMGTDELGRDVMTRVLHGGRVTILSALAISLGAMLISVLWAAVSAFSSGWLDEIMTRITDLLMNIPGLLFALIFVSLTEPGMRSLIFALIFIKWGSDARILRGHMLSIIQTDYIKAARSAGAGFWWILRQHIVRNSVFLIVTLLGLSFAGSILSISSLSFLGFGVKLPQAEWGAMINAARPWLQTHPYLILFPGLFIALTILTTHFLMKSVRLDVREEGVL